MLQGALLAFVFLSGLELRATTLIATNASWRYFRGTTSPSPGTPDAWRQPPFNDEGWQTGNATFFYGEAGFTGTELTDMQNSYTAVFLRKKFIVANPANVVSLDLTTVCDDGFVAYLNGARVASFRAPDADPDETSVATSAEEFVWNTQPIANPASLLVPGENTLAVIVLNGAPGSSDLVFDAELVSVEQASEAPRIVGIQPPPGLVTNLTSITVTFSEPVTNVLAQHFLLNDIPVTGVTGSGTTYTFTFPPQPFGSIGVTWGTLHQITDLDVPPQRFDSGASGAAWAYELLDPSGPALAQRLPPPGLTLRHLSEVEVSFNRPVSGVDAADLRLNGTAASSMTGSGLGPYRFVFAEAPAGTATLSWRADHGIRSDEPEPHPFVGGSWTYTVSPGQPVPQVVISEFLAENATGVADEDGDTEDWIELHNRGTTSVNLQGWSLTNDRDDEEANLWTFPSVVVPANGYLVVWASGKDRGTPAAGQRLHVNFKLNPTGDTLRLLGPELPRVALSEVNYPEQSADYSYGRQAAVGGDVWRYFNPVTMGAANGTSSITGKVEEVHFSVERGFYDRAFTLSLVCPTPGSWIRYTIDGSAPTLTNGIVYTNPVAVATSRVIRAAAFATNQLPSHVRTHTYLFNLVASRRLLPALSLVTGTNNLYGKTGIMESSPRNTTFHGPAWERPVSVELIRPEDNGGFHIDAGLRVAGGDYIRGLYNYRSSNLPEGKYSFRLYFRGEYGPGTLDYPFFPDTTVAEFNTLHLRAGMNDPINPLLKDEVVRALTDQVGLVASHGTFVNLFLNGVYKGVYNPAERVDDDFLQQYHGGGKLWDVMGPNSSAIRGDRTAWAQLLTAATRDLTVRANYQDVANRMDLPNFVDYLLPPIWADNDDWPHNNTRAARERIAGSKFRFYPWDAEFAFTGHAISYDTIATTLSTTSPPWGTTDYQRMFNALKRSYEFKLLFADRVHRAFFNNGPMTDERIRERYNKVKASVAPSISGFSDVVGTWINGRRRYVTNMFQKAGFLLSSNAPVLSQFGGTVPAGYQLTLSNLKGGPIYYSTDGVDPRVPFDSVPSASAKLYGSPVKLDASTRLLARSLDGTNWSALVDVSFATANIGPAIRISEIMYNPPGGDPYEFIELYNAGGLAADLSDFSMEGVTFRFPNPFPPLAPGARLVLANDTNPTLFSQRYPGVTVAGRFGGSLNNGGERIALLDRAGRVVVSATYDDNESWPAAADGLGASLEISDLNADPNDPANWHASAVGNGSPGAANSIAAAPGVRINEVVSESTTGEDWLELYNPGGAPVNLAGWSLSDSGDPRKYVFPPGFSLAAGGYLRVNASTNATPGVPHTGFGLDRQGDTLALFDAKTNLVTTATFGPAVAGYSHGFVEGRWTLCEPTPASVNEAAVLGSNDGLRLNEYLANPEGGDDWFELRNPESKPVAVQGCFLGTSNALFRVTAPVFVGAKGFVVLKADENPGPDHVDFKLTAAGDMIFVTNPNGVELDRVSWRNAMPAVATGRLPDGTGAWTALPFSASPGASNYLAQPGSGLRLNEIFARQVVAQANLAAINSDWLEVYNPTDSAILLTGFSLSVGKPKAGEWVFPAGTTIDTNGYLVVRATTNATPGFLNLGRALRDGGTTLSLFDDHARLLDTVSFGPQLPDTAIGRTGNGWQLLTAATPGAANAAAATMGNPALVRINEWFAESGTNTVDWFELYNPDTAPVNLAGFYLTDDPSIAGATNSVLQPLTFIRAGGFLQIFADGDTDDGPDHVGFSLDEFGETLRLNDPTRATVDSVAFLRQAHEVSEGRLGDGGTLIVAFPDVATPGASNVIPATDNDHDSLPDAWEMLNNFNPQDPADGAADPDGDGVTTLNEYLAGTDPRNASSVLRLSLQQDASGVVTLSFSAVAGHSYSVLYSDNVAAAQWQQLAAVPAGSAASEPSVMDNTPLAQRPVRYYRVVTPATQ